jgi:Zn-dependent alcohol dehydrogenase
MTCAKLRLLSIAVMATASLGVLFLNEHAKLGEPGSLISQAQARIGRPMTPMSYAGVARRTTRRAVYGTAAVGAAAVGAAAVYGSGCVQAVDAYGRVYTRCY